MADSVIVVGGTDPQPAETASADFLAGVAATTAVHAQEEAQEAVQAAEQAAADAAGSAQVVMATASEVAELRDDVAALSEEFAEAVAIMAGLTGEAIAAAEDGADDSNAPDVVVNTGSGDVTTAEQAAADNDTATPKRKKKETGFGWNSWFGDR